MGLSTLSIVAWLVAGVAVVTLYTRHELFGTGVVTIAIQAAALLLWAWARIAFGKRSFHGGASPTSGDLVTSGPYRWLRHPIYASILYFTWAGVASHLSLVSVTCGVVTTGALLTRVLSEERLLLERYPGYAEYARRTRRLIPFLL